MESRENSSKQGLVVDRPEVDRLFNAAYLELKRLAAAVKRGDPAVTLNTTALVHEAWIKLATSPEFQVTSEFHFKRIAARAMRQLLVEAARRRSAERRGGPGETLVLFNEELGAPVSCDREVVALDAALDELEKISPRQALVVEMRFFGGLPVAEAARVLEVSEETVHRDWRVAKAWLALRIRQTE